MRYYLSRAVALAVKIQVQLNSSIRKNGTAFGYYLPNHLTYESFHW